MISGTVAGRQTGVGGLEVKPGGEREREEGNGDMGRGESCKGGQDEMTKFGGEADL